MFARIMFDRTRAILVVLIAVLAAGVVTFYEIPKQAEPEIDLPTLTVVLAQTGLRAVDADRLLVNPVARKLRTVAGVKELRSMAYAGGATITLEFETPLIFGTPFDSVRALAAVRERLEAAEADLPTEAKVPRLQQLAPQLTPLVTLALFGPLSEAGRLQHARALRDQLRALPVVADADIVAEREQRIEVTIDPFMLSSFGLDAEALVGAVSRANRAGASGGVDLGEGRLDLSVAGLFSSTSELLDLPIKANNDSVVRLRDVATARMTLEPRTVVSRFNGQPATLIAVKKRAAANVIDAMHDIRGVVTQESQHWPAELQAGFAQDRSFRIRARIQELRNALVSAVIAFARSVGKCNRAVRVRHVRWLARGRCDCCG
jgi:multidrug efflux pump